MNRPFDFKRKEQSSSAFSLNQRTEQERRKEELDEERQKKRFDETDEISDIEAEKTDGDERSHVARITLENPSEAIDQPFQKREFFSSTHATTANTQEIKFSTFFLQSSQSFQKKEQQKSFKNFKTKKSWTWPSAIMPVVTFFLSHVTRGGAQESSFSCPNGTKMGVALEYFPKFRIYNESQNKLIFIPSSCMLAECFYNQARNAAEKVSEICFQNLENPNSTLQKKWEESFLQFRPLKESWMAVESLCRGDLEHLKSFNLLQEWFEKALSSSQQRQEEWIDAARWYPSPYTEEFQKDLQEYPYLCLIDAEEKNNTPAAGQKTRWSIVKGAAQFPYRHLESIFDMTTEKLLMQHAMGGDHLLVTLKKEEDPEAFSKKLKHLDPDITVEKDSPYGPEYYLQFKKTTLKFLRKILEACRSLAVDCDFNSYGQSTVESTSSLVNFGNSSFSLTLVPNDTNYTDQTNLKSIQASQAWASQHSSPSHTITVIDSGINPHEDLSQNMWNNSKPNKNYTRYEYEHGFVADPAFKATPLDNHGTHCAGIIGAVGNNRLGIAGIVWNTSLMFCKATSLYFKEIDWQDRHVRNCVDHAFEHNASIISISYRDTQPTPKTFKSLERIRDAGIILVTSAGNDAKDLEHYPVYPASYAKSPHNPTGLDNILVVGAVDDHDQWRPSSNYGSSTVHLAAPGVNVLSTVVHNATSSYARDSGTSMATPHVAGTLALMKEHFPGKPYTWLIEKLLNATDRIPLLTKKKIIYGRLNIAKALEEPQTCSVP